MADKPGVWGIDIGQAGLKAIRLQYVDSAEQVVATAFDYVPHPKILSQPDAIPEELIPQAIEKFLSRNDLRGDQVAISVPGQSALARFIQLPPVEASKVGEIVKYEARQQIPFALEEVIWDYQTLGKGTEESGFLLEAEVGLFAMKRDLVMQQLKPFTDAGVEVDLIQIAPLALYNYLSFDQYGIRIGDESVVMDEYTIVLDMGADNTTLLVSNGQKIWIRNVPIGGNHFTRALTKEMKLTFAKAEHLKCNATKSPDPRAVFQALRPVFNDYVSEIQRSIGFFSSVNRDAKISRVLGMGNGFKLAGLQKFLQQNLQYEVNRVETFGGIVGDAVLTAPLFEENILSFAVPYGVALQGLKQTRIRTSLLPREIATARTIVRKKPWAVGVAAALLLGLTMSAFGYSAVLNSVSAERWQAGEDKVKAVNATAGTYKTEYDGAKNSNLALDGKSIEMVRSVTTRELWIEVYKAINECVPRDTGDDLDNENIHLQNRMVIHSITTQFYPDLAAWKNNDLPPQADLYMSTADRAAPPTGAGYVFKLAGYHYHHDDKNFLTATEGRYVLNTLVKNLQQWTLPTETGGKIGVRQLGISHATLTFFQPTTEMFDPNAPPTFANMDDMPGKGPAAFQFNRPDDDDDGNARDRRTQRQNLKKQQGPSSTAKELKKTFFLVEFIWKPTTPSSRKAQDPTPPTASDATPGANMPAPGSPAPAPGAPAAAPNAAAPAAAPTEQPAPAQK
ncbi:MAG: type IV pilus assembly protein PilM [Planctomycetaceae bacterium]